MQFSDEFLGKWEHIINEVAKTEVPLECLKKVVIKLHNKRQQTINVASLRRQGLDTEDIELLLNRVFTEHGEDVKNVDWIIDAARVAEMIQPETDKILHNLK